MFTIIINEIKNAFEGVLYAFQEVLTNTGMINIVVAIVFACIVTRFIIMPVLGGRTLSGGSDKAKKKREKKE